MSNTVAIDAERSVLGGILITCEAWPPEVEALRPSDFVHLEHAKVFAACWELRDRQEPVDALTVRAELMKHTAARAPKDGWAHFLSDLDAAVGTAANLDHHAKIVRKESARRDVNTVLGNALQAAKEEGADADKVLTGASLELARISEGRQIIKPVSMRHMISAEWKAAQARKPGEFSGLPTGFAALDRILCGMVPGSITTIAARPSMGKSTLARNILVNQVTRYAKSGLMFSLEMTEAEIAQAALAAEAQVDLRKLRTGRVDTEGWSRLAEAGGKLSTDALHVVDRAGLDIEELRSIARSHRARHAVDVVVVDYLQLVVAEGRTREEEVSRVMQGLKALASELGVPLIALSQLNRSLESRNDKRPMLSDLRESGSIEQDSHQVVFIYRDEFYNPDTKHPGVAELGVSKNRNGPTGIARLRWTGPHVRFDPMDHNEPPPAGDAGEEAA